MTRSFRFLGGTLHAPQSARRAAGMVSGFYDWSGSWLDQLGADWTFAEGSAHAAHHS